MTIVRQPGMQVSLIGSSNNLFEIYEMNNPIYFVKALLSKANTSSLEMTDALGYTLLHKACLRCDTVTVAALLFAGASPSHYTVEGVSAIHLAASGGLTIILNLLVQAGGNLNHGDNHNRIALHYAADSGHVMTIAWLLHHPSSTGRPDSDDADGVTPLHLACAKGHFEALEYMLLQSKRDGYPLNVAACDRISGNTCLHALFLPPGLFSLTKNSYPTSGRNVSRAVWQLLLLQPSTALTSAQTSSGVGDSEKSCGPVTNLCEIRNHANERAFDLAKGAAGVAWQVTLLFRIFYYLLVKWPDRAHQRLLLIYSLIWWLFACLPLLSSLVSLMFVSLLPEGCQWIHFLTCFGLLWFTAYQRHRLDDGTDRPNPYFSGTVWTGLIVTCFSFSVDISLPHLFFWPVIWLSAGAVAVLFFRLISSGYRQPSRESQPYGGLINLVETQSQLVYNRLHDIHLDISNTQKPVHLNDLYCPHCDIMLGNPAFPAAIIDTKHCKMCKRCFANLDHHCLFIMHCVYDQNQRTFLLFLLASACFTGSYALAAAITTWSQCYPDRPPDPLVYQLVTEIGRCVSRDLPQCLVLWPFNIVSCIWACVLANDQCLTLTTNQPYRRRLVNMRFRSCFCSALFLHWRTILNFLITGRQPFGSSGVKPV